MITWSTPASEGKMHGVGGLALLGITQCNLISASLPCTVNFTPTSNMVVGSPHQYACTQTNCGNTIQHNGMTATITIAP